MKNSLKLSMLFALTQLAVGAQIIEFNDVRARITNTGVLFMNPGIMSSNYQVPKNLNTHAIFAASLWCAGEDVNGQLKLAAMRFGQVGSDFFAGPYSSSNDYTSTAYLSAYGTGIWRVSKAEINSHIGNWANSMYAAPPSITSWPANGISGVGVAQNLAPFVDMNNNGIYEPNLGEYPDIRGDEAIYVIMNDAKSPHTETGGEIMGIEIHTMAYQYASNDYRDRTTFLNYRIFNRGVNNYQNF